MSRLAIVTFLGFASLALADTGTHQGVKVVPMSRTARKASIIATVDGAPTAPTGTTPGAHSGGTPLAAPSNDECSGAIPIPDGPFPIVTTPVDITDATPQGGVDPDVCPVNGVDQDVWFSFTPSVSGQYIFSTCAGNGAIASLVYDTVIGVFDACPGGPVTTLGCNDTAAGCPAAVPGAPYVDQSTQAAVLTAGNTYYIAAGHWSGDVGGVAAPFNLISVLVDLSPAPPNDNCSSPTPLALDRIVFGTTASATNDYRSATSCFTGVGQIATSANGLDVVFSFTPPSSDSYSFRYVQDDASAALRSQSPALYLTDVCPAPNNAVTVPDCLGGANRMNDQTTGNGNRSEEIKCVPLTAGTPYYLFFDDRFTGNPGGPLAVEVTRCHNEIEPNDTPATATVFNPNSGCFMEGSAIASGPAADIDFYDLGAPPAGSKIFVGVDAAASNQSDYEMRITNSTNTLGYDDNDGTSWVGSNAPIITGVIADGTEIYARINSKPVVAGNEPYSIFARIETGVAENESGTPDPAPATVPSNGTMYGGGHLTGGGFVKGTIYGWDTTNGPTDLDCFKFIGHEGDNLVAFSDNNPARNPGVITNVWPVIRTIDGNPTPANTRFVGQTLRNLSPNTPSAGLTGVTPSVTSEFMHYRLRYTGAYAICYEPTQDVTTENPTPGFYPLPYQGSISLNCGPVGNEGPGDPAITKSGPAGPVLTGAIVPYVVTVSNNGPGIAQDIRMIDTLPPEVVYAGATIVDSNGFLGNTECLNVPTPGQNDGPLDCTTYSLVPGQTVTYTISVQVGNCGGAGLTVVNNAAITSYSQDTNTDNNAASWTFTTSENGTCQPIVCDGAGCILDGCATNNSANPDGTFGHCDPSYPGPNGDHCSSQEVNCDDNNLCTEDSCDPTNPDHPCINDPTSIGNYCDDGNDCTHDECDPVLFCVFPPFPAGRACNDFQNCTDNDACDGYGICVGHSRCDDGQPCTDDFADEANNCACDNPLSFPGTICDDQNVCTIDTYCDGTGGGLTHCTGGTALNCDDNNACTDDSCDVNSGCINAPNTAPCNDGNACTSGDACGGGTCNGGPAPNCNDNNPCTDDSCDPASGCVYTNNTAPCGVTGNLCVSGGTCGGGTCQPGGPVNCDDNNCCTNDSCDPATGCVHTANTTAPVFTTQPSFGNIVLWSPNHGYVDFTVADSGAAASSTCGIASISFASCSSSQPENAIGTGDGNSTRDCVYNGGTLSLRAERDGACSPIGRVYETKLIAVDVCGNTTTSSAVDIPVWHDRAHPPVQGSVAFSTGNTNDTRAGNNGTYGTDCGSGIPAANGSIHDHSDADPEMEITQQAAISVNDLHIGKSGGNVTLTWTTPGPSGQVTRFHVYKLDPLTLFWTQVAELTRQTTSFSEPVDGSSWQYKVSAVIK